MFDTVFPTLVGSATKPVPGYEVKVFDDNNYESDYDTLGKLVIKLPMPPGFMLGIHNGNDAFINKYLKNVPGYYQTGEIATIDDNGYIKMLGREEEVITIDGQKVSPLEFEQIANEHDHIAESACVSYKHKIKDGDLPKHKEIGDVPMIFAVLNREGDTVKTSAEMHDIEKEVNYDVKD